MTRAALVAPPEIAYRRKVLFAVELLDGVTLARVSQGIEVRVTGLARKPIVNGSGLFVWTQEGNALPTGLEIIPEEAPFLPVSLGAARMQAEVPAVPAPNTAPKLITLELAPARNYPFGGGVSCVRGTLLEDAAAQPQVALPGVPAWLQWVDDSVLADTWRDSPVRTLTGTGGDFAAVLRLAPKQKPRLDAAGRLRLRLRAQRPALGAKSSPEFTQPPGSVQDAARDAFSWIQFQP